MEACPAPASVEDSLCNAGHLLDLQAGSLVFPGAGPRPLTAVLRIKGEALTDLSYCPTIFVGAVAETEASRTLLKCVVSLSSGPASH